MCDYCGAHHWQGKPTGPVSIPLVADEEPTGYWQHYIPNVPGRYQVQAYSTDRHITLIFNGLYWQGECGTMVARHDVRAWRGHR